MALTDAYCRINRARGMEVRQPFYHLPYKSTLYHIPHEYGSTLPPLLRTSPYTAITDPLPIFSLKCAGAALAPAGLSV